MKNVIVSKKTTPDNEKLKALSELQEFCPPAEMRKTVLQLFFYYVKNIERENLIPDKLHDKTENIQFLIHFFDRLEDRGQGT